MTSSVAFEDGAVAVATVKAPQLLVARLPSPQELHLTRHLASSHVHGLAALLL
jgi:hypothetical protein